jgi:adenylate kinase family enzyme
VIIVCPPRTVCVWGALRRSVCNLGRDMQAVGCPERIDLDFYRWIWRYPNDARQRLDAALSRHPHLTVVELTSRGAMRDFLRQ